jgi:hypothetical protein
VILNCFENFRECFMAVTAVTAVTLTLPNMEILHLGGQPMAPTWIWAYHAIHNEKLNNFASKSSL